MAPECTNLDINLLDCISLQISEFALLTQSGETKSFNYWSSIFTHKAHQQKITLNIKKLIDPATITLFNLKNQHAI